MSSIFGSIKIRVNEEDIDAKKSVCIKQELWSWNNEKEEN